MNTTVIVKDGQTKIILHPSNEFEEDIIDRIENGKYKVKDVSVDRKLGYGKYVDHVIEIYIDKE